MRMFREGVKCPCDTCLLRNEPFGICDTCPEFQEYLESLEKETAEVMVCEN